jgi:hypothetical protein
MGENLENKARNHYPHRQRSTAAVAAAQTCVPAAGAATLPSRARRAGKETPPPTHARQSGPAWLGPPAMPPAWRLDSSTGNAVAFSVTVQMIQIPKKL